MGIGRGLEVWRRIYSWFGAKNAKSAFDISRKIKAVTAAKASDDMPKKVAE